MTLTRRALLDFTPGNASIILEDATDMIERKRKNDNVTADFMDLLLFEFLFRYVSVDITNEYLDLRH